MLISILTDGVLGSSNSKKSADSALIRKRGSNKERGVPSKSHLPITQLFS